MKLQGCLLHSLQRVPGVGVRLISSRRGRFPMVILAFILGHWFLAAFVQVFFLHRYSSHQQFLLSPGWERFFHLLTWVGMGSSYLPPRAYAIIHRAHHAYSDTPKDPHSP